MKVGYDFHGALCAHKRRFCKITRSSRRICLHCTLDIRDNWVMEYFQPLCNDSSLIPVILRIAPTIEIPKFERKEKLGANAMKRIC